MFGFMFISKKRFELEKRKAEKSGHRIALAELKSADAILRGHKVLSQKNIKGRVVILGDEVMVSHCYFDGKGVKREALLEIH